MSLVPEPIKALQASLRRQLGLYNKRKSELSWYEIRWEGGTQSVPCRGSFDEQVDRALKMAHWPTDNYVTVYLWGNKPKIFNWYNHKWLPGDNGMCRILRGPKPGSLPA